MKKSLLSAAALALIAWGSAPGWAEDQQPAGDPVLATLNGEEIHRSEVVESARSLPPEYQAQIDQILPALVERYIDLKLLAQRAAATGLQNDAEVKQMVARLQQDVMREVFLRRYLKDHVTDDMLKARYQDFLKKNPPEPEVHARHILVQSEDEAKAVIKELEAGKPFEQVAAERSKGSSGQNGGDLGYFTEKDMVPEFAQAAFAMKPGEFSKTPVKTQFGWHVIKVEDRRDRQPPSFEEAKPQLENDLQQELVQALVQDLRKGAKIEMKLPAAPAAGAGGEGAGTGTAAPPTDTTVPKGETTVPTTPE